MNEVQYERMQENIGMGQHILSCVEAIIADNGAGDSIADVYRSTYKYTDCGPYTSVRLHTGEQVNCGELADVMNRDIAAILVGSIVEGSDVEITADWIELAECDTPEEAVSKFNAAVAWVNDEATTEWQLANQDNEGE